MKYFLLLSLLLVISLHAENTIWQKTPESVAVTLKTGVLKLSPLTDRAMRVQFSPLQPFPAGQDFVFASKPQSVPCTAEAEGDSLVVKTTDMKVTVSLATGALKFADASGKIFLQEPPDGGRHFTPAKTVGENTFEVEQSFVCEPDESLYGLGQGQDGVWDWRGRPVELRQQNTQIAIPFLMSTRGYGLLWNNAALTWFNPIDTKVPLVLESQEDAQVNGPKATEDLQKAPAKKSPPKLAERHGVFQTDQEGDYVFFATDGDRRKEFSILVDGKQIGGVTNMWVPYTVSGVVKLPAKTTVNVTLRGGGANALLSARRLDGTRSVFRSRAGDQVDYTLFYGPQMDDVISSYRTLTGAAPLWPKWAYGFWQCRERYNTQDELIQAAQEFRKREIPIDLIIQDWQYWGKYGWGAYEWDEAKYPDPAKLIADLHALNTKFMISAWPNPSGKAGAALRSIPHGVTEGSPYYDVFNPAARALRWELVKKAFFDIGTDAWWQDAAEPGDDGMALVNKKVFTGSGDIYRNAYPLFHSQTIYEGQRAANPQKRVVNLTRSSYLGQQRYAAGAWSGDIKGDWTTFRRQIPAGLNFCLTGQPYWTTDSGGFFRPDGEYTSPDYNDLQSRWFEWSTFCPIQRIHGYNTRTEVWNWLPATQEILTRYIRLRYRMLPYLYSCAWQVTANGSTLLRALPMDFGDDTRTHAISDEHLFGPGILVAPVTSPGATNRAVYLPSGTSWINFWTGETSAGGQEIQADARMGIIPLFVRAGSIVPFGPDLHFASEKPADPIELRIYPGADGKFTLYEDEGDSYRYEQGAHATIPISWDDKSKTLTLGKRSGEFPGMLESRTFNIMVVRPSGAIGDSWKTPPDNVLTYQGNVIKVPLK